jgi:hypothetical protein
MVSRNSFVSLSSTRSLTRQWVGRLAYYRLHSNDEHYEALVTDGLRFVGLSLENSLSHSAYWAAAPLARKVAVLLFLVDRGVAVRTQRDGRIVFEALPHAEEWIAAQPALQTYVKPTLEIVAALRQDRARRLGSTI